MVRRLQVVGSFSETGMSDETLLSEADFLVSGTFVGTVVVEVRESTRDNWAPACESTTPTVQRILLARAHNVRVRCSAYTSGAINYALEAKTDYLSER